MVDVSLATEKEAQVVEAGMLEFVALRLTVGPLPEQPAIDEDERTEVEVVADTALLIVDGGMLFHLAVLHRIVVAI